MATIITFTAGTPILSADVNANFQALNTDIPPIRGLQLVYGPTISAPDAAEGNWFIVTVTNASAHAFSAPLHPADGRVMALGVYNATGGAIATATFNAVYHVAAYVAPATGLMTTAIFLSNGLDWFQVTAWSPGVTP